MGVCSTILKPKIRLSEQLTTLYTYPRTATVAIHKRNSKSEILQTDKLEFILSEPCLLYSETIEVFSRPVWASLCTLSGFDPRGTIFKKCQDTSMIQHNSSTLFISLFDGHGSEGENIAFFCSAYAEKFYKCNKDLLNTNISDFLTNLTESCDIELKASTRINSLASGCTAVFIIITESHLYTASVGDSRAILARNTPSLDLVASPIIETTQAVKDLKRSRPSRLVSNIYPVQLTKDQKPEDAEEMTRLVECGARVKRLVDDDGNRVGPYRVWEMNSNVPGLSMSRSIGDQIAKSLGVIATPIVTEMNIDTTHDNFIVVASDGVWDTMDNDDVCNYVEYFRSKCQKHHKKTPKGEPVFYGNSNIAQLLCEEARVRWFSIVEDEDVLIDDISCVIIEFTPGNLAAILDQKKNRKIVKYDDIKDEQVLVKAPTIKEVNLKDPKRVKHIF